MTQVVSTGAAPAGDVLHPQGTVPTDVAPAAGEQRERVPGYVWAMLGSLGCNIFSGNSQYLGFPIGPDRILLALALALLVLDPHRPRMRWHGVYTIMAAVVLWTGWSALTAGTLFHTNGMFALLDRICVPFLMFAIGPLVFTTPYRRTLLLRLMALLGIYLGLTAIFEIVGPKELVWPSYIMNPDLGILFGRARGPFLSSEPNGMVMGLGLFCAMTLWGRSRGGWRVVATVSIVLTALGVVLCLTRSIWIATVVAGLVIGWLVPSVRRRLPGIVVGLTAVFTAAILLVPAVQQTLTERFNMVSSVYDRQNTNAAGLRIVQEHPIFGIGWSRFVEIGSQWVRQADDYPISNVAIEIHNVFLSRAAETGIPGAVLWGLAVALGPGYVLYRFPRGGDERTWALLLVAAMTYWFIPSMTSPNPYPLPNNLMWLIGGMLSASRLVQPEPVGTRSVTDTLPPDLPPASTQAPTQETAHGTA